MPEDTHHYKLTYFDIRALGEPIRLLFRYVGQQFEDNRISWENWPEHKTKTPYGKLPILDVDHGRFILTQSSAIARFIAEKYGLTGKGEEEQARVSELLDLQKDFFAEVIKYIVVKNGFAEGDEEKLHRELFIPGLERTLPVWENILKKSKSGFLVDSGLTFADFFVADFLQTIKQFEPEMVTKHSELENYIERVYSVPTLQEYIKHRKYYVE
ncbi:glutathione S-transferase 1 [Ditylenchus destructor]|nr:glutathione S-transferase 1 [Ditylenchus destructor]